MTMILCKCKHPSTLQGVDAEFDAAEDAVSQAKADLHTHLKDVRKRMGGGREIVFVTVNKDSHLIEVRCFGDGSRTVMRCLVEHTKQLPLQLTWAAAPLGLIIEVVHGAVLCSHGHLTISRNLEMASA